MIRNIKHHGIIVTGQSKPLIKEIRQKAIEIFKTHMEAGFGYRLVGEIQESLINNFFTFMIFPDGSKEGHETSEDGDVVRKKIVEYLDEVNSSSPDKINYVELYYGTDDHESGILHSDRGKSTSIE
ncbi:MAG: hypothetical protein MUF42_16830 [Cytophagaceae bacterium]|jgi:hypothetical protein|nr:hypothetical protein [Cytophagaceae bacterium]